MEKLVAQMRTVTPVFCAGALPKEVKKAEIRPLSIRGALRWWYRALDPEFVQFEPKVFGATTGEGQSSPVRLTVKPWLSGEKDYREQLRPDRARDNGAAYLGYTLYLHPNDRRAVPEGEEFETVLSWQWLPNDSDAQRARRAWAAALWLFGHLGGLGTRARRGFGTIALQSWSGWPECDELPPAHGATTPAEWKQKFDAGFRKIRQWFPASEQQLSRFRHQHLPATFNLVLSGIPAPRDVAAVLRIDASRNWLECLHVAGTNFQTFRADNEIHKPEFLAAFGLPIKFRNGEAWRLRRPPEPGESKDRFWERSASRIHFRVVQFGKDCHCLVWRAHGPLAPHDPILLETRPQRNDPRPVKKRTYDRRSDELLRKFLEHFATGD